MTKVTKEDLSREVIIHLCKDGTISYRHRHEPNTVNGGAPLPVFSVEDEDQAKAIQHAFGKLEIMSHPDMPGELWYKFPWRLYDLEPRVEHLFDVGALFKEYYHEHLEDL